MAFKFSMVDGRINMIYDRATAAKSNAYHAMQSAQAGNENACANYLNALKADMDSIRDQWQDMQRAIDALKEQETSK